MNTTAGKLLQSLAREAGQFDLVIITADLDPARAEGAKRGDLTLSALEQFRLAEATLLMAPAFRRQALRLRGQLLATRDYVSSEFATRHSDPVTLRWEREARMR